ncbi:MAG: hypothetical protein LBU62_03240 [Bacteroidales bacterium]|jgi:hypothetical protein|nr:hypothetical protein [Bacteroidales bacterium]
MNGLRYVPEINGVVHSWGNLVVNISGVVVTGITQLNYKDSQTIDNIYGAGQHPVGRGYGRIEPSASITLLRSEVESIRAASPTGRLQDIAPFDVIVQFIPVNGQKIVTHRIRGAQFRDDGLEISEGDTSNATQFELVVRNIEWR